MPSAPVKEGRPTPRHGGLAGMLAPGARDWVVSGARHPGRASLPSTHETNPRMSVVLELILLVLNIYWWVVIASAIMSWLVAFNVVNTRNQVVYQIGTMLYRLTDPALRPIRRVVPNLGGIDISPILLLLAIWFLQRLIERYLLAPAYMHGL
jgi:YggT family protein